MLSFLGEHPQHPKVAIHSFSSPKQLHFAPSCLTSHLRLLMWIWWNPAPFWPSVRLRGAHPSCASFTVCSLAVMWEQPLRLGVKQLKGKEPGLPCGQQSPAQLLSVSISSELRTWALLNVELLFVAEVPGGLSLASPHGSPRAASCPLQLWLLPKLQGALAEAGSSGAPSLQGSWH